MTDSLGRVPLVGSEAAAWILEDTCLHFRPSTPAYSTRIVQTVMILLFLENLV